MDNLNLLHNLSCASGSFFFSFSFLKHLEYLGGPEKTTGKGKDMRDAMHEEQEPDLRAGSVALIVNL